MGDAPYHCEGGRIQRRYAAGAADRVSSAGFPAVGSEGRRGLAAQHGAAPLTEFRGRGGEEE